MDLQVGPACEEIPLGSHVCQLFQQRSEAFDVAAALMLSGLAGGERCVLLASEPTANAVRPRLAADVPDLQERVTSGQLTFITQKDPYLLKGKFDPYFLVSAHQTLISQSLKAGWPGLRFGIDMSWLTRGLATSRDLLRYEASCDAVFTFQQTPIIAIAQYDHGRLSASLVNDLLKIHPISLVGTAFRRNPEYVTGEEYLRRLLHAERDRRHVVL